ncbi:MAG: hypothetical protein FWG79_05690 [Bacteroidales bacterium]|nr:hypothetical protein [Bacteroidales bacterium]
MKKEITIVKKIALVVAILFAGALVAQACPNAPENQQCNKGELVVVNLGDLSEEVQLAINAEVNKQSVQIREISQCQTSKKLKVTAINAENGEVVLIFEEDGKLAENKE